MNCSDELEEVFHVASTKIKVKENFHISDYDWYNENKQNIKKSKWYSREERLNKKRPIRFKKFKYEE